MKSVQDIQITLARMGELLRLGGAVDWATALETLHGEIALDPVRVSATILAMYGGMGGGFKTEVQQVSEGLTMVVSRP
jgi:hypothetical protein